MNYLLTNDNHDLKQKVSLSRDDHDSSTPWRQKQAHSAPQLEMLHIKSATTPHEKSTETGKPPGVFFSPPRCRFHRDKSLLGALSCSQ